MAASVEQVSGELESVPLTALVPKIADARASGVLELTRGALRRKFEVRGGAVIRSSSTDPREYLGQFLVDFGMLSARAAATAFRTQEEKRTPMGKLLPEQGAVDEDRVRAALVSKIREGLLDSYRWEHGEIAFTPGEPELSCGVSVQVLLSDVHREAQYRAKLWKQYLKMFPSPDAQLRVAEFPTPHAVQPDEEVILELAWEGHTVGDALAAFRDGDFHVYRRLAGLVEKGKLLASELDPWTPRERPADGKGLVDAAKVLLRSGRAAEALGLASRACEKAPSKLALEVLRDAQAILIKSLTEELLSHRQRPYVRVRTAELASLELQPAEHYLLMSIDAGKDLQTIVKSAPMGELEALRILHRLVQGGVIGFRTPDA